MGREYKYIINWGLAFSEESTMNKLSRLAKEGWLLERQTTFRYRLTKGEPKEIIYSMDCKTLRDNKNEYFELFSESGWQHVCSNGPFHFFAAPKGTTPIYTERENYLTKYESSKRLFNKAMVISFISLVISILIFNFTYKRVNNIIYDIIITLISALSAGIFAPSLMTSIALYIKEKKS